MEGFCPSLVNIRFMYFLDYTMPDILIASDPPPTQTSFCSLVEHGREIYAGAKTLCSLFLPPVLVSLARLMYFLADY